MERDPQTLDLHRRLVARDPTSSVELAERFLPHVIQATRRLLQPGDDPQLADEASADAILSYLERPDQYDPSRMELDRFLRMSARRDLQNLRDREARRDLRLVHGDVELSGPSRNIEEDDTKVRAEQLEADALGIAHDDEERRVLDLMLDGERRTERFADALGIRNEALEAKRRAVKRVKDRLKKRLERSGWGEPG